MSSQPAGEEEEEEAKGIVCTLMLKYMSKFCKTHGPCDGKVLLHQHELNINHSIREQILLKFNKRTQEKEEHMLSSALQ